MCVTVARPYKHFPKWQLMRYKHFPKWQLMRVILSSGREHVIDVGYAWKIKLLAIALLCSL